MPGMLVRLTATKGPEEGNSFEIEADQTRIIGRSSKADLTIRDMGISRIHCQLTNDGRRCLLEDLNSKNGSVVNGERIIQNVQLRDQDVVKVGTSVFRVSVEDAPPDSAAHIPEPGPRMTDTTRLESPPIPSSAIPKPPRPRAVAPATPPPDPPLRREEVESSADAGALMGAFDQWLEGDSGDGDARGDGKEDSSQDRRISEILSGMNAGDDQETPLPGEVAAAVAQAEEEDHDTALTDGGGSVDPGRDSGSDPRIGRVIAGCRIEERIGQDALSTIYRGTQISMERPVELRLLVDEMTRDEAAVQRFVSAAQACGRLTHPHILQVYDAGETNGLYYVALERIDGKSVHEYLVQAGPGRPLPVETTLEVGVQICGALSHAHAQGIYHGSLDLDNILVTRHGIAKLGELGFTKWLEDSGFHDESAARPKPTQFSAPEQLQFPPQVEPRTDIYALGVVLFVMMSGHLPFNAPTEDVLERKILEGQHESLQSLRTTLPTELCSAINKAMAPDLDQRYRDAAEFQRELTDVRDRLR